jgi:hypothetical protein
MIFDFKLFELKYETYKKASQKAKNLGQDERSKKLFDWSLLSDIRFGDSPISSGEFFFDGLPGAIRAKMSLIRQKNNSTLELSKQKAYLDGIGIDSCIYDESQEFDSIAILANFIFTDNKDNILYPYGPNFPITTPFAILISIKWKTDENNEVYFTVTNDYEIVGWNESLPVLLYDKKSAEKFKKKLANFKNIYKSEYDNLRNFFMEWSTHEDLQKLLALISKIPENKFRK